jgi:2-oxoisovalerate ferredoxin oxidoreductase beta subunit
MKARRAIRKALEIQRDGAGFLFVEILSPCSTIWGKDPVGARHWVLEKMTPDFPLNVFRDHKPVIPDTPVPQRPMAEVLDLVQGEPGAQPASKRQAKPLAIKAAGPGGQGMLLLGILPAEAGMRKGLEVSWLPSYGPEMRSGSAHCHVCLSKERIGSSLVSHPDVLIAMNEVSLRKSAPRLLPAASSSINRSRHDVPIERRATSTEENCT